MVRVTKRGRTFQLHGRVCGQYVRLALGTRNREAAVRYANKIELAAIEGCQSKLWADLRSLLPTQTFNSLANIVGYVPPALERQTTWVDLISSFETHVLRLVASRKMAPTTWVRYQQAIQEFRSFLDDQSLSRLTDISRATLEQFKNWRLKRILSRKHSRGGGGLSLDIAILHRIFAYGIEMEILSRNPVKLEGRPGDNSKRGAQPFSAAQLSRLRRAAGSDLLAFLLLRWTGFRGSDAVGLRWEEIDWQSREINRVTQKRQKRVIVPIHAELLFNLEAEFAKRNPRQDERVLMNPTTNAPLSRPRLYERFKALGKRAEVADAHPHRFRDTFAVDLLLKGGSPFDVAKLLGDTVDTVEKYYAPFVRELRERARRILEAVDGLERIDTNLAHSGAIQAKPN